MPDELQPLQQSALEAAKASGALSDAQIAVSIWNAAAERQKYLTEASLSRYEGLKSFATLVVPLISIVTLGITVYIQSAQLTETRNQLAVSREANEDTQWREAMKTYAEAGKEGNFVAGVAAAAMMKNFLHSPRYGSQARDMALLLMPKIADMDSFVDLFTAVIGNPTPADLEAMITLSRQLNNAYDETTDLINTAETQDRARKSAGPSLNLSPFFGREPSPSPSSALSSIISPVDQLKHMHAAMERQVDFLSQKIAGVLSREPKAGAHLDLHGAWIRSVELSRVDLSGADLTDAVLNSVTLDGAILAAIVKYARSNWADTQWWAADEISGPLLQNLMQNAFPYRNGDAAYEPANPTREDYVRRIKELCAKARIDCPANRILFGKPARHTTE
jgi:hypothetical protein